MADTASIQLAGDVDYSALSGAYVRHRCADPRIAAAIHSALGDSRTVLNVGAGAGSYEPEDRYVLAVEPSAAMRNQRPKHIAPAVHGTAEDLPLDDQAVDASMAILTVHQWRDLAKGLKELRRVTRGPIVVVSFDGETLTDYWLAEYAPELISVERRRYPDIELLRESLGPGAAVKSIPVPIDCTDGFKEAFYARPEAFLEPEVRRSQSAWSFVSGTDEERIVEALRSDLLSGRWDERYGALRQQPWFDGSLRMIVGSGGCPTD